MRSALLALVCLIGLALECLGQGAAQKPAAQDARRGVVTGVVVNSNGQPVKKAAVQLSGYMNESRFSAETTTGTDGRFEFKDIPPGEYSVIARRGAAVSGFVGIGQRNSAITLTLHAGEQINDLVLHMTPPAVIQGRVVDEDGEPVQGAQVAAVQPRYIYLLQGRQMIPVDVQTTNDRGEFRLAGLAPGRYYVLANAGNLSAAPGTTYMTRYYPDAATWDAATPLQVRAGDEAEANFTLTPVKAVTVRGRIAYPKKMSWYAMMRPKNAGRGTGFAFGGMFEPSASVQVKEDGTFEAKNVTPGIYEVTANGYDPDAKSPRSAEASVTVADADVDGVVLTPVETAKNSITLTGEMRLDRGTGPAWDGLYLTLQPSLASDSGDVQIEDIGRASAMIKKDGTFSVTVMPGTYTTFLVANSNKYRDLYTKSVEYGGREVTTGFTVRDGSGKLQIICGTDGARIEGSVVDEADKPVRSVPVVAIPEEKYRARYEDYGRATTDYKGHFAMYGMRPGSYLIVAVDGLEDDSYMDPEWLRAHEAKATLVRADANGAYQLSLKAIVEGAD